ADVGFGLESHPNQLKHLPHEPHKGRIQMLLAETVKACVALHTLIPIDRGALDRGVNIDRSHGAYISAVSASHAFVWIDFTDYPLPTCALDSSTADRRGSMRLASHAETRQSRLA